MLPLWTPESSKDAPLYRDYLADLVENDNLDEYRNYMKEHGASMKLTMGVDPGYEDSTVYCVETVDSVNHLVSRVHHDDALTAYAAAIHGWFYRTAIIEYQRRLFGRSQHGHDRDCVYPDF